MGYADDFPCAHSHVPLGDYQRRWDGLEKLGQPADPVSLAATRSAVLEFLAETWAGGQQGEPVTFVLVDLDALGKVNRRCGHDLGDTVLFLASNRIHHVARRALAPYAFAADGTVRDPAVARLGDDEFLVVLPGVPTSAAAPTAAAIVAAIASDPFIVFDSTAGNRLEVSRCRGGGHVRLFGPASDGSYLAYEGGRNGHVARADEVDGTSLPGPDVAIGGLLVTATAGVVAGTIGHRHWDELLVAAYGVLHTAKTSARGTAGAVAVV